MSQYPSNFKPVVKAILNLDKFEYKEFLQGNPIKGPFKFDQSNKQYIYYG